MLEFWKKVEKENRGKGVKSLEDVRGMSSGAFEAAESIGLSDTAGVVADLDVFLRSKSGDLGPTEIGKASNLGYYKNSEGIINVFTKQLPKVAERQQRAKEMVLSARAEFERLKKFPSQEITGKEVLEVWVSQAEKIIGRIEQAGDLSKVDRTNVIAYLKKFVSLLIEERKAQVDKLQKQINDPTSVPVGEQVLLPQGSIDDAKNRVEYMENLKRELERLESSDLALAA